MEDPSKETAISGNWLKFRSFDDKFGDDYYNVRLKSPQFIQKRIIVATCLCVASLIFAFVLYFSPSIAIINHAFLAPISTNTPQPPNRHSDNITSFDNEQFNNASSPQGRVRSGGILKDLLEEASLPNKMVIITNANAAWAKKDSMLDLFLGSFKKGEGIGHLLGHVVIVAFDEEAYERCLRIHHLCYMLTTEGIDFSLEKVFMSSGYLKLIWRRLELLTNVLELGYSFVFTDGDIMWLRNPLPHLLPNKDFQVACDNFNGIPTDLNNRPNAGFTFVQSNNRTINMYRYWLSSRFRFPDEHDQDVLNEIKFTQEFTNLGLKIHFLDTKLFGGFCSINDTSVDKSLTMHANCCQTLRAKLLDLRVVIRDWQRYRNALETSLPYHVSWSPPLACIASWN